jgi:hypothetical protein
VQQWVDGYPEFSKTTRRNYMRSVTRVATLTHSGEDLLRF